MLSSKSLCCKKLQRQKFYTKKISTKTGKIPLCEEKLSTTYSEVFRVYSNLPTNASKILPQLIAINM